MPENIGLAAGDGVFVGNAREVQARRDAVPGDERADGLPEPAVDQVFLDGDDGTAFARGDENASVERADLNDVVRGVVARYRASGREVAFTPGELPMLSLRTTAVSRLLSNLVDNAFAYGRPPVEIVTHMIGDAVAIDVMDRGPGVDPADVVRLKQPFTRSAMSRSRDDGAAGAGLGLAIVERVARLHGGKFDLLPREGGGTVARATFATTSTD